jgi:glycosyltransferase involved in cell wall biosynthesis
VSFPLRRSPLTRLKYTWGIDFIVAISKSIRYQLKIGGVPSSRIRTVYEGMDLTLYPKLELPKVRRPGEPIVVGTIAHLSHEKGLSYLVKAAAMIPNVHSQLLFLIAGEGKCRKELEDEVRKRGLQPCFQFLGFQNRTIGLLQSFDIFVLPSLSEGLSSAILTAMAASLPGVATDVGGIPELIRNGEDGLLVPPADSEALARAIEFLATNPEERFRMGQAGRKLMEERFTLQRKILETEELCASFLREKERRSQAAHA